MRQLTSDPEKDRGPSWSSDGKLLYFYSHRGPRYEIWSIRADGSGLHQVSRTSGLAPIWPRVMPDGAALYVDLMGGGAALMPLNRDGTATKAEVLPPIPVAMPSSPFSRLSPDGSRFAVGTSQTVLGFGTSGSAIWLYSMAHRSYEKLADEGKSPQWLPDGKHVLFVSHGRLNVIDVTSKQSRTIPLPRPIDDFAISPDGRALYLNERTAEADIWMMSSL
jgi:Tol biopolymer transport system component